MAPNLKRLVASIGIILFLPFYLYVVLEIGRLIPDSSSLKLLYFGISGVLWGVPILPLIHWAGKKQ